MVGVVGQRGTQPADDAGADRLALAQKAGQARHGASGRCGSGGATGRELGQKAGHGVVLGEGFCMEVHG